MARITESNSGINWTGLQSFGNVSIQIGYEWPIRATHAMYSGMWEDAVPQLEEINKFLRENQLPNAVANDGPCIAGTAGFKTKRFQEEIEKEYSEQKARSEAQLLRRYRREGTECHRRAILEGCEKTGKADGFLLKDRDMELFLKELHIS